QVRLAGRGSLWRRRDHGAPPPPLRGERPFSRPAGARRHVADRDVPGLLAGGNRGTAGASMVRGSAVSSRAQIASSAAASPVCGLRGGGPQGSGAARRRRAQRPGLMARVVHVVGPRGSLAVGDGTLVLIAGPCMLE